MNGRSQKNDLAVVCCFFNPCHYKSRRGNYERFRRQLDSAGVETLTVELAFDGALPELEHHSDVIQVKSNSVMWQKERLLSIGMQEMLLRGHKKIAWLDADLLFESDDWSQRISDSLERSAVCQVCKRCRIDMMVSGDGDLNYIESSAKVFCERDKFVAGRSGWGWAARSEVLEQCLPYDAAVIDGGDTLIDLASFSYPDFSSWKSLAMNVLEVRELAPQHCDHYFAWAENWGKAVKRDIGFADQDIRTMFHGEIFRRDYSRRYSYLKKYNFDPSTDIRLNEDQAWDWSSDKPQLHDEVRQYFYNRREDG